MPKRSKSKRKRTFIPWWISLIVAGGICIFGVWFFLIRTVDSPDLNYKAEISAPVDQEKLDGSTTVAPPPEVDFVIKDLPSKDNPWIVIIIDDLGPHHTTKMLRQFMDLPFDVTYSVIPGYVKSNWIGRTVSDSGGEVFIHLPMEPVEKKSMKERYMVMTGITAVELNEMLDEIIGELPFAVGMNNHMGSKATRNDTLMNMLALELKQRDLVFVDSRTVSYSRGHPNMRKVGVPSIRRDVFLDAYPDTVDVQERLQELIRIGRSRGWAVGIGHAKELTLENLKGAASMFQESGLKVVSAKKLISAVGELEKREDSKNLKVAEK